MRSVFSSDFCLEPPPRSINYNPLYRPDLSPEVSSPSSTSTNSSFSLFLSCQPSPTAVNSAMLPTYQVSRSQHHGIYHQDRSTLKFPSTKMHTQSFSHTPTPQVPASQQYKLPPQVPASQQYKLPPQVPASQQYKLPPQVPASQQYKLPPQVPFQLFNNSSVSCNLKLSMSPVRQGSYRMIKNICLFCKSNKESYRCYSSHALKDENGDVTCPILFKYVCPTCQATGKDAHTKAYCPLNPLKSFKPFRPWTRCNPI